MMENFGHEKRSEGRPGGVERRQEVQDEERGNGKR